MTEKRYEPSITTKLGEPTFIPPAAPLDTPEGSAVVVMSVTVFLQWVEEHPDQQIADWGVPHPWSGLVYEPWLRTVDR
jgi:hypothetical protein